MILSREKKEEWSLWNKIGFRFVFLYFTFYCFSIIGSGVFASLVEWVAVNVLNITYDFSSRGYGSGDTTFQYVLLFINACFAVFGTLLWSLFDKRKSYNQLNYALILILRFVLVAFMFVYGFIKIFHMQMIPPTYSQLVSNLGDMSPMGLAWTFMGYSKAYIIFAGASEVLAGILLVSRRLQTIGALLVVAVMGNVFMMNMAFDIPVKIFSFHLMLMGGVLFLMDSKRFIKAIILKKEVPQEVSYPVIDEGSKKVFRIIKLTITIILVGIFVTGAHSRAKSFQKKMNPLLKGVWEVDYFEKNGEEKPPLLTDRKRWRYFIVDAEGVATIMGMKENKVGYSLQVDKLLNEFSMTSRDSLNTYKFSYKKQGDFLDLSGKSMSDSLFIKLRRRDDDSFLLKSRGFNWINERPNNQ